jgi:hypothetical protein
VGITHAGRLRTSRSRRHGAHSGRPVLSQTDRTEPRRPWAKEDKARRRQWIRGYRARVRDALSHEDYDRASEPLRRTQGWMTW